jgi:hypothetical protein
VPFFIPDPAPRADLRQQTFRRREQFLHRAGGSIGIMCQVEDRDLETHFGSIVSLGRERDAMSWRLWMLAGLQEIKRLKEDPAELLQIAQATGSDP